MRTLGLAFSVTLILAVACAPSVRESIKYPTGELPPRPRKVEFLFSPPEEANQLEVVVAVINPAFEVDINCEPASRLSTTIMSTMARDYRTNMEKAFEEILLSKGYTILGTFESTGAMTFGEKEEIVLALQPKIMVQVSCSDESATVFSFVEDYYKPPPGDSDDYVLEDGRVLRRQRDISVLEIPGTLRSEAKLKLLAIEPLTGEVIRMSEAGVAIGVKAYKYFIESEVQQFFDSGKFERADRLPVKLLRQYDSRTNALADVLKVAYPEQANQLLVFFDPTDIEDAIAEALRAKELKRL